MDREYLWQLIEEGKFSLAITEVDRAVRFIRNLMPYPHVANQLDEIIKALEKCRSAVAEVKENESEK